MIPLFPLFTKLDFSHKEDIEKLTHLFPPYSDYNFTSLWTYDTDSSIEISLLNENLIVRFTDYMTLKPFYSFIGRNQPIKTAHSLIDHSYKTNVEHYLKLIPEDVIRLDNALIKHFQVKEDQDNHDYIISVKDITLLPEEKYKRKKYLVDRFKRKYPSYRSHLMDLSKQPVQNEILDLFFLWEERAGKKRTETENELIAIKRLLAYHKKLNVYALGIFHDNSLIAFNLYEVTHGVYGISAFQKADKNYTGVYALLSHEAAKHLHSLGCNLINYEQDLGIEGLRLSKSLWKPVHYLKKYIISPKK
ncbi:MAG: phosphatidylglycerol lysyltransferase domain-containing protein [bacterium]